MFDSNGKQRGYGFCEYEDASSAACAIRQLNNYDMDGRRLRVDTADANDRELNETIVKSVHGGKMQPLVSGTKTSVQHVHEILDSLSQDDLKDILTQMKGLALQNPEQVKLMLTSNPAFAYTLLRAQEKLEILSPSVVNQLIIAPINPYPMQPMGMPMMMPNYGYPPHHMMHPQMQHQGQVHQQPHHHPNTQPGQPQGLPDMLSIDEQQRQIFAMVMNMTPQEIEACPPEQRTYIEQIRSMYGM